MKQEHRFVAELYHCLAPHIDMENPVYVSLDGQAALTGMREGLFRDASIPDLWFTLRNLRHPTLIEAKALNDRNHVLLMQAQLAAWRPSGHGRHRPHYWVAASLARDTFYLWTHRSYSAILSGCRNRQNTVSLRLPSQREECESVEALAHTIRRMERIRQRR
jgi:hypothetical protein